MAPLKLKRMPAVLERCDISRSHFLRCVTAGRFPPPVKIGRTSVWPEHEIDAVIAAHVAGANDDELRSLVADLVKQRATLRVEAIPS